MANMELVLTTESEINEAVAVNILGWKKDCPKVLWMEPVANTIGWYPIAGIDRFEMLANTPFAKFSPLTNPCDTMRVVEAMYDDGWGFSYNNGALFKRGEAMFYQGKKQIKVGNHSWNGVTETFCTTVSLAALQAKGFEAEYYG